MHTTYITCKSTAYYKDFVFLWKNGVCWRKECASERQGVGWVEQVTMKLQIQTLKNKHKRNKKKPAYNGAAGIKQQASSRMRCMCVQDSNKRTPSNLFRTLNLMLFSLSLFLLIFFMLDTFECLHNDCRLLGTIQASNRGRERERWDSTSIWFKGTNKWENESYKRQLKQNWEKEANVLVFGQCNALIKH